MEINQDNNKTNDMFLAVVRNPTATTYDFLNGGINPENTQLKDRDYYRSKEIFTDQFQTEDGKFDEETFNQAYQVALWNYNQLADEEALERLKGVKYNPFSTIRPLGTKKWDVEIQFSTDYNPYRTLYSRDGLNTMTESVLSLREIAQKGGVHDLQTGEWDKSVNTWNLYKKFFGDTLVYAQWDEDGIHVDPETGQTVKHKAGDWKVNDQGSLYLEKLGNREVYGKQVVSVTDILTTDGSFWNKLDPFDSDGREKSVGKVAAKTMLQIAPLLIPGVQTWYAGARASISLLATLPTFYKSLESLLLGDHTSFLTDPVTKFEGWTAKHNTKSSSDKGSEGMWNFEQMGQMVTDIFAQIYEQRAMASLSKKLVRTEQLMDRRNMELQNQVLGKAHLAAKRYGISAEKAIDNAVKNLPELQKAMEKQSQLSKAFSLGYMALTSTGDVYGEAVESGYDRRTAGFASLLTAAGQYGIMMNNRMGDWFLDASTGYTMETNKALMRKSIKPYLAEINKTFSDANLSTTMKKAQLANITTRFKNGLTRLFKDFHVIGEGMWKNAVIEGVEEVTEQVVEDMSKAVVDVMGYLGWTKGKGSFDTVGRYTSAEAYNEYLANFVGGVLGGSLFELERSVIAPALNPKVKAAMAVDPSLNQSIYDLVANGHKDALIDMIKAESKNYANSHLSYLEEDGAFKPAEQGVSHADLVEQKAIEVVNQLESIFLSEGVMLSDEEIVNKAIRDQIMISELERGREGDSLLGLETLALTEFKEEVAKMVPIKANIENLETQEAQGKDVAEQLKYEKELLKESTQKINSILDGEHGMKYFNQLTFSLSEAISSKYGSFDRDTYLQAKYGKSYDEFSDSGVINKKTVNEEWEKFLDSTDVMEKLRISTEAFLNNEQLFNPIIANYINSGYSVERSKVYDQLIDMRRTAMMYTSEMDPQKKNELYMHFIDIMDNLEKDGVVKVGLWDNYANNLFDMFKEYNMIEQVEFGTNDAGEEVEITSELTDEFLNSTREVQGQEITTKDYIEAMLSQSAAYLPNEAFNPRHLIELFNGILKNQNEARRKALEPLYNKENKTEEDLQAIKALEDGMLNVRLTSVENLPEVQAVYESIKKEALVDYEETFPEIFAENISEDDKVAKVAQEVSRYSAIKSREKLYEKPLGETLKELLGEQYKELFEDLTDADIAKILVYLGEATLLHEVAENLDNLEEIRNIVDALNSGEATIEEHRDVIKTILESAHDIVAERNRVLGDTKYADFLERKESREKKRDQMIIDATPEAMQIQNIAYDSLIKALSEGIMDKEIFEITREMKDDLIAKELNRVFLNPDHLTTDQAVILSENLDNLKALHEGLESMFTEIDQDEDEIGPNKVLATFKPLEYINYLESLKSGEYDNLTDDLKSFVNEGSFNYAHSLMSKLPNLDLFTLYTSFFLASADLGLSAQSLSVETQLNSIQDNTGIKKINKINSDFFNLTKDSGKYISNPLYDWLAEYFLTLDSGEKPLTVLEVLKREEASYRAASGASEYISEGLRPSDIKQTKQFLELLKVHISAASHTDIMGQNLGFIKMRQDFAKRNELQDDVLNLELITPEQGQILINDLNRIITRLDFMLGLATFNSTRQATEQAEIGKKVQSILVDSWDSIIKNDIGNKFIPREEVSEILNSSLENDMKLLKIEDAVYDFNKGQKIEAFRDLMNNFENAKYNVYSRYHKDMTIADVGEMDIINYLGTVLAIKSSEYKRYRYNQLKNDNKAPFFMQEMVSKQIYAKIVNPEIFNEVFKVKLDASRTYGDAWTISLGAAGSGKTTAIMGSVIDIIRQTNSMSNIWVSAPEQRQVDKLHDSIIESVGEEKLSFTKYDKKSLFAKFGQEVQDFHEKIIEKLESGKFKSVLTEAEAKNELVYIDQNNHLRSNIPESLIDTIDFSSLPNLLVVDEITHFSKPELELLAMISTASLNSGVGNYMSLVGLGDQNQLGYAVEIDGRWYNHNVETLRATFTPILQATIRSANDIQRINNDILLNLAANAARRTTNDGNEDIMNANVQAFLRDVNTETGLKHYLSDTDFKGMYVSHNNITEPLKAIAHTKRAKPETTIGILTENGEIPSKIQEALDLAGLSKDDLMLFTIGNVQGSEVDYFIFGTSDILKWSKYRDNLKALYTFASRSTQGSVIFDAENQLKKILEITNSKPESSYKEYEDFSKDVIEQLKKERLDDIAKKLEDKFGLEEELFKWRKFLDTKVVDSKDLALGVIGNGNLYEGEIETDGELPPSQAKTINDAHKTPGDFKILIHSFYNNPGAVVTSKGGIAQTITVNNVHPPMDLNGWRNVEDNAQIIVDEWMDLKHQLLYKDTAINTSKYRNYLEHIFNSSFENRVAPSEISVKYLLTAQKYVDSINDPYAKHEADPKRQLKGENNDVFINLTAEVTIKGKTHYIVLATFPRYDTLIEKGLPNAKGTENEINIIKAQIDTFYKKVSADNLEDNKLYKLGEVNPNNYKFITGLRIYAKDLDNKPRHYLHNLEKTVPGIKVSNIRIFPGNLESFKDTLNRYSFGEKRSEEKVLELFNILKNKPYVVTTFESIEALEGNPTGDSSARLMPIGSSHRDMKTMIQEILDLKDEVSTAIKEHFENSEEGFKPTAAMNAKFETILNPTQILDILIKWGQTSTDLIQDVDGNDMTLLDLFTASLEVENPTSIFGADTSILDILNNFRGSEENKTTSRLLSVVNTVKSELANDNHINDEAIKKAIIGKIRQMTGWGWNFYNLFVYSHIIDKKFNKQIGELMRRGFHQQGMELAMMESPEADKLKSWVRTLLGSIRNWKFYYAIPLALNESSQVIINRYVSGEMGFSTEFFANKFYISGTPEGPRILLDFESILDPNIVEIHKVNDSSPEDSKTDAQEQVDKVENQVKTVEDNPEVVNGPQDPVAPEINMEAVAVNELSEVKVKARNKVITPFEVNGKSLEDFLLNDMLVYMDFIDQDIKIDHMAQEGQLTISRETASKEEIDRAYEVFYRENITKIIEEFKRGLDIAIDRKNGLPIPEGSDRETVRELSFKFFSSIAKFGPRQRDIKDINNIRRILLSFVEIAYVNSDNPELMALTQYLAQITDKLKEC